MFDLDEARALLRRTPDSLRALLAGLPDAWITATEGPNTWSPRDAVAHLADLEETDWMPRVRMILETRTTVSFPPIDRERFRQLPQDTGLDELLDQFAQRRDRNLAALDALRLRDDDLARMGHHPAFGPVTLQQLLATWVVHDLTHLVQIARVMAKRYEEAVGPWREYLRVVRQP